MVDSIRESVLALGVRKGIQDLLFSVFPDDSFSKYFDTFKNAVDEPSSFNRFIGEIRMQFGLGAVSHVMIAVRRFLSLPDFSMFTRDYVRRCCDLVEFFTKSRLADRFGIETERKPLGAVIVNLKKYEDRIPNNLLANLYMFNKAVYCPAKHEFSQKEEEYLFSVADAIAVTFISIWLCQQLEEMRKRMPFG